VEGAAWVAVVWKRVEAEGVTAGVVFWSFCSGGNCVGSCGVEECCSCGSHCGSGVLEFL
jgi:hypothetical protein